MKDFKQLIVTIEQVHGYLQTKAANAVNQALTIRNWLIGFYIVEFEQEGEDKAKYGSGLLNSIASQTKIKGLSAPELSRCRQFYQCYPQMIGSLSQAFKNQIPESILGSLSQKSSASKKEKAVKPQSGKRDAAQQLQVPPDKIISKLSFSHLVELIKIDNTLKRTFYEIECIKGTWSVRELKRQINSQYFERSGLSAKPEKLAKLVQQKTTPQTPKDIIKNMYAFEFFDLKTRDWQSDGPGWVN